MIDGSVILTFDGAIITGLFVFYAFLVALAERFEKASKEAYISDAIRYLASVQLVFAVSAILVLVGLTGWALGLSIIGLFLLVVYSLVMILGRGLVQVMS